MSHTDEIDPELIAKYQEAIVNQMHARVANAFEGSIFTRYARSTFNGMLRYESPFMVESNTIQFRFPRSKKRRIRSKWARQSKNFRIKNVPMKNFFTDNKTFIVGHPDMWRELDRQQNVMTPKKLKAACDLARRCVEMKV